MNTCSNECMFLSGLPVFSSCMLSNVPDGSFNWIPTNLHFEGISAATSFISSISLGEVIPSKEICNERFEQKKSMIP